jgi:hypothetical protein
MKLNETHEVCCASAFHETSPFAELHLSRGEIWTRTSSEERQNVKFICTLVVLREAK